MSYTKVWESTNVEYRQESVDYLRELFPIGSTVTTTIKHVTSSGLGRTVAVLGVRHGGIVNASYHVARVLGWNHDNDRQGVYVRGAGMDMSFHLTYELARALYANDDNWQRAGYLLTNRNV